MVMMDGFLFDSLFSIQLTSRLLTEFRIQHFTRFCINIYLIICFCHDEIPSQREETEKLHSAEYKLPSYFCVGFYINDCC